ncbi:MAG TPA: MFS transporter [Xanthobacteraceae bacterium]|nr:MFS transporter [Xanthobacteraceae bacterium]
MKSDVRRFALHVALGSLAWGLSNAFSAVFLLRVGLAPARIFLVFAAVNALRFVMRPVVLAVVPQTGIRRTLILGAVIIALSYPALALVDGVGAGLAAFVVASSLGQVFYFTTYHVFFAALSDDGRFGTQVGLFQALGILAAVVGPAAGGVLLATHGPWLSFGAASLIALAGIVPLLGITEPKVPRDAPRGAYAAAKTGVRLYFTDGWIQVSLTSAWSIVLFEALHDRYESYGGTLSLAALAAALGGIVLGRLIDNGHARSIAWINAGILAGGLLLRSLTFGNAAIAVAVAIGAVAVGGFYMPTWMTVVYTQAKISPCSFRFQFAAEGGWDAGAVIAGLLAAAFCAIGLPVEAAILLALPMVLIQALLLNRGYARQVASAHPDAQAPHARARLPDAAVAEAAGPVATSVDAS